MEAPVERTPVSGDTVAVVPVAPHFTCEGRTPCSQMHSYDAVKFFLRHRPGVRWTGIMTAIPANSSSRMVIGTPPVSFPDFSWPSCAASRRV